MRKLLVRIFNIGFLALAVFAGISLASEPIFSLKLKLVIKKENLQQMLISSGVASDETRVSYRIPNRDALTEDQEVDILGKLTAQRIAKGVGDVAPKEGFVIEAPAKMCFQPTNQTVVKDFINENIDSISLTLAEELTPKLKIVIKDVAMEVAAEVLSSEISKQVDMYWKGGEGSTKPPVNEEQVNGIISNVYNLFEKNEETTVEQISTVLMGTKDYHEAVPQPTGIIAEDPKTYYVKTGENEYKSVKASGTEEFNSEVTYYTVQFGAGVLGVISDLQSKNVEGFEKIDYDNIDNGDIEKKMVEALQTMPGLTEEKFVLCEGDKKPTGLVSEASKKYYVLNNNEYVEYTADEFDPSLNYYSKDVVVLNADEALLGLMDYYFGQVTGKSVIREEKKNSKLIKSVQEMIKGLLPMDQINSITTRTVRRATPLLLTGMMAFMIFPWALFGLVTLFRTFRRNKCWTKFWIVFVFGFIQPAIGVGGEVVSRFVLPKVINVAVGRLPKSFATYGAVAKDSQISFRFGCYIAGVIYLVMIVAAIIYAIIAHRLKVTHKLVKRLDKDDKRYRSIDDDSDERQSLNQYYNLNNYVYQIPEQEHRNQCQCGNPNEMPQRNMGPQVDPRKMDIDD